MQDGCDRKTLPVRRWPYVQAHPAGIDSPNGPIGRSLTDTEIDLPTLLARRVTIRPVAASNDHAEAIDVTKTIVAAIAEELHRRHGGNPVLDWLEAERMVEHALRSMGSPSRSGASPQVHHAHSTNENRST